MIEAQFLFLDPVVFTAELTQLKETPNRKVLFDLFYTGGPAECFICEAEFDAVLDLTDDPEPSYEIMNIISTADELLAMGFICRECAGQNRDLKTVQAANAACRQGVDVIPLSRPGRA